MPNNTNNENHFTSRSNSTASTSSWPTNADIRINGDSSVSAMITTQNGPRRISTAPRPVNRNPIPPRRSSWVNGNNRIIEQQAGQNTQERSR